MDPLLFCDEISQTFRNLSKTLNLTNTDFIRTTEKRHKKSVQKLWQILSDNDDIYLFRKKIYIKAPFPKPWSQYILITIGPKSYMKTFIKFLKTYFKIK